MVWSNVSFWLLDNTSNFHMIFSYFLWMISVVSNVSKDFPDTWVSKPERTVEFKLRKLQFPNLVNSRTLLDKFGVTKSATSIFLGRYKLQWCNAQDEVHFCVTYFIEDGLHSDEQVKLPQRLRASEDLSCLRVVVPFKHTPRRFLRESKHNGGD